MQAAIRRAATLVVSALATAVILGGCAAPPRQPAAGDAGTQLALTAVALVGTPYRLGGDDPATGLDCSGLVRYAAASGLGIELPRQAEAMSRIGETVDPAQLRAGDLVFFNTLGRPFSHVGIYLDDQRFVHAPTQRGVVRIERLSQTYWRSRFDGARRLDLAGTGGSRYPAVSVLPPLESAPWPAPP